MPAYATADFLESGMPNGIYDFSGSVAGLNSVTTTRSPIRRSRPQPGVTVKQAGLQVAKGTNPSKPLINPAHFQIPSIFAGTDGCAGMREGHSGTVCGDTSPNDDPSNVTNTRSCDTLSMTKGVAASKSIASQT